MLKGCWFDIKGLGGSSSHSHTFRHSNSLQCEGSYSGNTYGSVTALLVHYGNREKRGGNSTNSGFHTEF